MTLGEARELVRTAFLETLPALQVGPRLRQMFRLDGRTLHVGPDTYALPEGRPVRMISIGKAAADMAHTTAEILAGVSMLGIVAAQELPPTLLDGFRYFAGGHPYPNERSWQAAEAALALLDPREIVPKDVVLFLISGGGSAMLDKPLHPSVSLDDLRLVHEVLVTCGAPIEEINAIRKHLSAVKGGRLAERAAPAAQVTLYASDVPEHLPSAVASGPTMPDETTVEDCLRIVKQYSLREKLHGPVRELLESGAIAETPKPGHPCFANSRYYSVLSNADAIAGFAQRLRSHGVRVEVDATCDGLEYRRAADTLLNRLARLSLENPGRLSAVVSGGELSCPVTADGSGVGGRNQAFGLYCAMKIAGKRAVVLSAGTDGIDGNSPAAGALADGSTIGRAAALKLDPESFLRRSDSHSFFKELGDALYTGPTGTNVRDLRVVLAWG